MIILFFIIILLKKYSNIGSGDGLLMLHNCSVFNATIFIIMTASLESVECNVKKTILDPHLKNC